MNDNQRRIALNAIRHAQTAVDRGDPVLANYMLRDLVATKEAVLSDLSWAMDRAGCCKNDVLFLIKKLEEYIAEQPEEPGMEEP